MADGGDGGAGYLNNHISSSTRTAAADGGGEDVVGGSPPPFKIRKLGAPGTSSVEALDQCEAMAARDGKIGERMNSDEVHGEHEDKTAIQSMPARGEHVDTEMTQFKCGEVADDELHKDKIKNKASPEEMDLGKTTSSISELEIERLCVQMDEMASLMRYRIKPSAPLCSSSSSLETEDQPVIDGIRKELSDLQGSMSKLKSQLKPFWHTYPYEEDYVAPEEEKNPKEKARKQMEDDQEVYDSYLQGLESKVGHFGYATLVSPMHFTHYTPRQVQSDYTTRGITLQIFSFKIANISLDLEWPLLHWPLKAYGVVAARDSVDRKRNVLFHRLRDNFQEITEKDSFLCLTGPSRAISAGSPLEFEVELKLKGGEAKSEDSVLINRKGHYNGYDTHNGFYTVTFDNCLCTTELSLQKLYSGAVQATFLRVGIVKGSQSPFSYGGRVACSSPPQKDGRGPATPTQVVLLDSRYCAGGKMPIGEEDGYLDLSRHVVSVELRTVSVDSEELEETLKVVIEAYSPGGSVQAHVMVRPQYCGISKHKCDLNGSKVKITIAWSPIVSSAFTRKVIL
ncbi:uncharacterized protein LOC119358452 [Triticum dicoccoides]|uniref:uncharacterized protein LOC119358452 n=1 Tax=Triticum dicoccoides TaxID=85692 RepID=UPI00188DD3D7|nr:uncharacterized protein LOC119358452 [Triticum dicoccoides]